MIIHKILIANRGEIAVRIIRACREMGITTVSVYSEIDRKALHVRMADEAVYIGPADPAESYLNISRIVQAARDTQAEAIHPGYGFLSENPEFAAAVREAGLIFIGPSPEVIRLMGNKAEARAQMQLAGVPILPGYQGIDDDATLQRMASDIGFPVIVKAASGGGGRGMRTVWDKSDLPVAINAARYEARRAFGEDRLILEHYVQKAHHIEFQILADQFGNTVHLYERECSLQRRHQKIIEESPSPLLNPSLRTRMGAAAVAVAREIGYQNAGTVEFILNSDTNDFYFLEMNTRIQVEHPVTELVTGLDLVQWQIQIAAGDRLPFRTEDILPRGHAIECRLYAEDPSHGFLPVTGKLLRFVEPTGPGVRIDSGYTSSDEITIHYDSLLAKLIVYAEKRPVAIRKMVSALQKTILLGITTNWQFLIDVLNHPSFEAGAAHTTWIEEQFPDWQPPQCEIPAEVLVTAALTQYQAAMTALPGEGAAYPATGGIGVVDDIDPYNPWRIPNEYRLGE